MIWTNNSHILHERLTHIAEQPNYPVMLWWALVVAAAQETCPIGCCRMAHDVWQNGLETYVVVRTRYDRDSSGVMEYFIREVKNLLTIMTSS